MKYIKAKFEKSRRSYAYKTEDDVKAGDIVETDAGVKLAVVDESVSEEWVKTYGSDKIKVVKKVEEPASAGEKEVE